jgi:RNA polymerase sigma-70 factor (ECF subfamily)
LSKTKPDIQDDERLLIKRLQSKADKKSAFNQLVNLYKEPLYWHIRHIVKQHEDADDVLQNTFIKVFRYIENFKGNSKLYSWLYRIATNESNTFLSKKAKRLKVSNEELQDHLVDSLKSDPYFDGGEIEYQLHKAVNKLPEKQQLVFRMRYFEDLKFKQISEILDASVTSLKTNYHHAQKKIKKQLSAH